MEPSKTSARSAPHARNGHVGATSHRPPVLASARSLSDLRDALDLPHRLKRNPYGTLAVAAGVGYVLGGGLFSSPSRRLLGLGLRLGLRLGAVALLRQQLNLLVDGSGGPESLINPPHEEGAAT